MEAKISKPKAPKAPDPQATAAAQTGTNVSTAIANNAMGQINQVTPDGSLTYSNSGTHQWRDPGTGQMYNVPQYTATTTLSPEAQAIRDQTNAADLSLAKLAAEQSGRAGELLNQPMGLDSLPPGADRSGATTAQYGASLKAPQYSQSGTAIPQLGDTAGLATGYQNDFSGDKKQVVDALMGQIDERRGVDMEKLRSQLANQGVGIGTEQYSRAMDDFQRSQDAARTQALLAGGQEQSRLTGLSRDEAQFGNSAKQQEFSNTTNNRMALYGLGEDQRRYGDSMQQQSFADQGLIQGREDAIANNQFGQQQQLYDATDNARTRSMQEQFALRNQPINEITALLSGSQVSTPQFGIAQSAQMPTTDIAGITQQGYANQMAAYNAKQQQQQAMMGGLFNLGASALTGGMFGAGGMFGKAAAGG
jgi:hypothetical protein